LLWLLVGDALQLSGCLGIPPKGSIRRLFCRTFFNIYLPKFGFCVAIWFGS
jgi:hypothetical protein